MIEWEHETDTLSTFVDSVDARPEPPLSPLERVLDSVNEMKTGKVEYAPDYKGSSNLGPRQMRQSPIAITSATHQRLKDSVVEAALRRHKANKAFTESSYGGKNPVDEYDDAVTDCEAACDALLQFEEEHGK